MQDKKTIFWLGLLAVLLLIYVPLNRLNINDNFILMPLDDVIPFIPYFIIPYLFFYPFSILMFYVATVKNKLNLLVPVWVITLSISYIIYLTYPTAIQRLEVNGNDIFLGLLQFYYSVANPYNVLPSLHAALMFATSHFYYYADGQNGKRALPLFILIIISPVFLKLHYTIDILGGILVGYVSIILQKISRN